jgi:hypothetical protein
MTCYCGKTIYYDLAKQHNWKDQNIQNIWKSTCSKQSLHQWVVASSLISAQRIVKMDTSGMAAIFNSINQQILGMVHIMIFMGKSLASIFTKYQMICKGGQKLTKFQFNQLRAEFTTTFAYNAATFKNYPNFSSLQKASVDIFNEMIIKSERGDFNYCSCIPFFQRTNVFALHFANGQCNSVCSGRNILDEETEPDEYMEE